MRRLAVLCLAVLLLLSLLGCEKTSTEIDETDMQEDTVEEVVEPEPVKYPDAYYSARDFHEGVAWVSRGIVTDDNGYLVQFTSWEAIDTKGETVFALDIGAVPLTDFDNGVAVINLPSLGNPDVDTPAELEEKTYCNIVDKTGRVAFPREGDTNNYRYSGTHQNGVTFVRRVIDDYQGYWSSPGIVNSDGSWILEPSEDTKKMQFGETSAPEDGLIKINYYKNYWFFDTVNRQFIEDSETWQIREEKTRALVEDRLYADGMIYLELSAARGTYSAKYKDYFIYWDDHTNGYEYPSTKLKETSKKYTALYNQDKKLIPLYDMYEDSEPVGTFNSGYSSIMLRDYAAIIDKTGNPTFEPVEGAEIFQFSNGLAMFKEKADSDYSYIDITGEKVITGVHEGYPFSEDGFARVIMSKDYDPSNATPSWTFVDKSGEVAFYR